MLGYRIWLTVVGTWLVTGAIAQDFCEGDGSICDAYNDLNLKCSDDSGEEYFECICGSGWVPVYEACQECKVALGGIGGDPSWYSTVCEEQDLTVAPIPTSIISQQEKRNSTATVPPSTTNTYTFDTNYTTLSHPAYTITISGEPSATLPDIGPASPTEDDASTLEASRAVARGLIVSSLATFVAMMVYM